MIFGGSLLVSRVIIDSGLETSYYDFTLYGGSYTKTFFIVSSGRAFARLLAALRT